MAIRREIMRRFFVGFAALSIAAATVSAYATEDPIFTRQELMKANGGAAGAAAAMIKGEVPFHPAVARASLMTMHAVSYSYGDYFPPESNTGDTKASPKIWEDAAGFAAALQKFQQDADAALKADPQDLEAFKAAFGQVAANCQSCHESFRLETN
jgi:cytochrome c556